MSERELYGGLLHNVRCETEIINTFLSNSLTGHSVLGFSVKAGQLKAQQPSWLIQYSKCHLSADYQTVKGGDSMAPLTILSFSEGSSKTHLSLESIRSSGFASFHCEGGKKRRCMC